MKTICLVLLVLTRSLWGDPINHHHHQNNLQLSTNNIKGTQNDDVQMQNLQTQQGTAVESGAYDAALLMQEEDGVQNEAQEEEEAVTEDTWSGGDLGLAESEWQGQLAKYTSFGMDDKNDEVVREHKTYVRKIHMLKDVAKKCIKLFEYILT